MKPLSQSELLHGMTSEDSHAVLKQASLEEWREGQFLFREGDPAQKFFLLERGRIRFRQVTVRGDEVLLRFICPGEVFGYTAAANFPAYPADAEVALPSRLLVWSNRSIRRLMHGYPRLADNLFESAIRNLLRYENHCQLLATEPVEFRVRQLLGELCASIGRSVDGTIMFNDSFRERDLACLAGTSVYSVSRILSNWRREGVLAKDRRQICILRPEQLVLGGSRLKTSTKLGRL